MSFNHEFLDLDSMHERGLFKMGGVFLGREVCIYFRFFIYFELRIEKLSFSIRSAEGSAEGSSGDDERAERQKIAFCLFQRSYLPSIYRQLLLRAGGGGPFTKHSHHILNPILHSYHRHDSDPS